MSHLQQFVEREDTHRIVERTEDRVVEIQSSVR